MDDVRPTERRIDWSAKLFSAVLIVLVVVGHINSAGFAGPFDIFPVYSYHVAGFAFVSGYLYSARSDRSILMFIKKRVWRLVLPMLLIYAVYGMAVTVLRELCGFTFGTDLGPDSLFVGTFVNGHQFSLNYPMWFIAPFCASQCLYALLRGTLSRALGKAKNSRFLDWMVAAVSILLGVLSVHLGGSDGLNAGWKLFACRSLFFMPWLALGRLYSIYRDSARRIPSRAFLLACVGVQLLVLYACGGSSSYIPSWGRFPHGVELTLLTTAAGMLFLWRICEVVAPMLNDMARGGGVAMLGDNTFSIMCHHVFGFFLLNVFYWGVSRVLPVFNTFDVSRFMSTTSYYYYPHGLSQFAIMYALVGIAFSLGVHAVWTKVKKKWLIR